MKTIELKKKINGQIVGNELLFFNEIESTNRYLYQKASKNDMPDGTVVISDSQSAGRGRLKRTWISPKGKNLYISVLLKPNIIPNDATIFTFLASCALKDTFDEYGVNSKIKWPNDILIDGKKVAGVLTELKINSVSVEFIIVGIGVNINMTNNFIMCVMPDISHKVTSLSIELGKELMREEFAATLINNIDDYYLRFLKYGKSNILSVWVEKWGGIGTELEILDGEKTYKGLVESVDENGFLYIRDKDGKLEKVIAGDIAF